MTYQISRLLRLALESRWSADWNPAIRDACTEFGIGDLAYQVNFAGIDQEPQNFYRGNWTLESLTEFMEPELPGLAMWIGPGVPHGPGERQMPRVWDGIVTAGWRYFLRVPGRRTLADLTNLREATESAMVAVLAMEFSEVTYRGDLVWQALPELVWLDQDNQRAGWVQEVEYSASFEVTV
jgi:hypothetical protein